MKIKVPQDELVCCFRFVKCCDYVYSYTVWPNHGQVGPAGSPVNRAIIGAIAGDNRNCISVYCKTDHVLDLFQDCKNLNKSIILVTGQSDISIDKSLYLKKPNNIVKLYSENVSYRTNDLIPLPMGSASGTWIGNNKYKAELYNHNKFKLVNVSNEEPSVKNLVFMCFDINTNRHHRSQVYNYFDNKLWVTNLCQQKVGKRLREDTFIRMVYSHRFIISPFGNGIDCGRTWLSLQLGCIPVMPYHLCFEEWAKHLPIVLYRNINEITPQYLMSRLEEFNARDYSYEYLRTSYWKDRWEKDKAEVSASAGS